MAIGSALGFEFWLLESARTGTETSGARDSIVLTMPEALACVCAEVPLSAGAVALSSSGTAEVDPVDAPHAELPVPKVIGSFTESTGGAAKPARVAASGGAALRVDASA